MLRANLASRPFYNVRAVRAVIGALAALVLAFTLFNVVQMVRLSRLERTLGTDAADVEAEAARLRAEAARIRAQIDQADLDVVVAAAQEANAVIDERTFSWTALLAWIERTLPADVRITRVDRGEGLEGGGFPIAIETEAYDIAELNQFVEGLEDAGAFHDVLARRQSAGEGLILALVEAVYVPDLPAAAGADAQPAADQSSPTGGVRE